MKKKALVAVAGTFRLCQAIYLTYLYSDYDWDIIILRYGEDVRIIESIRAISVASKRFRKVYISHAVTQFAGKANLLLECAKMFLYYIVGKRKLYARSVILQSVDDFEYNMLCVACSYSIMEGAMLCFADEIETIIMEEGMGDYIHGIEPKKGFFGAGAKLLYKMQYINLLGDNEYKPLRFCKKFIRNPEKIPRNNYLEVDEMFNFGTIDREAFEKTIADSFQIDEKQFDVVIYTAPLWNYNLERYYPKFERYISGKYKDKIVLLKRHPQDNYRYIFKDVEVIDAYTNIPGELILRHYENAEHIFMFPSTILLDPKVKFIFYELIVFSEGCKDYSVKFEKVVDFLEVSSERIISL